MLPSASKYVSKIYPKAQSMTVLKAMIWSRKDASQARLREGHVHGVAVIQRAYGDAKSLSPQGCKKGIPAARNCPKYSKTGY